MLVFADVILPVGFLILEATCGSVDHEMNPLGENRKEFK